MKTLFVIIGVIVILGILFSSGSVGAGLCVRGVGCISSQQNGGISFDRDDSPVTISAPGRP